MTLDTTPQQLWTAALGELELQMTHATFDTWLRDTTCIDVDADNEHTLVIAVKNNHAVDWLEHRLRPVIDRTLHRLTGNGTTARFIVTQHPASSIQHPPPDLIAELATILRQVVDPATRKLLQQRISAIQGVDTYEDDDEIPDFDCYGKGGGGYYPVSNYADQFWKPLLKRRKAFLVYTSLRARDKAPRGLWTSQEHVPIRGLCESVPCSRNTILGETRHGEHRAGALDLLRNANLAQIDVRGAGLHTTYHISVRVKLPLLTPAQAAHLPDQVQAKHIKWLRSHQIDPEPWLSCVF